MNPLIFITFRTWLKNTADITQDIWSIEVLTQTENRAQEIKQFLQSYGMRESEIIIETGSDFPDPESYYIVKVHTAYDLSLIQDPQNFQEQLHALLYATNK